MRSLVACLLVVTSCTPAAHVTSGNVSAPPPTPSAVVASSAPQPSASAALPTGGTDFAAIQLLDATHGYVARYKTQLVLTATADGGRTWAPIGVPAAYLNQVRFIDASTGWVAGFSAADTPNVACNATPPSGDRGCRGVVLRTTDGGQTWQDVLDLKPAVGGRPPVVQVEAVDAQTAWALTGDALCGSPPCATAVRRTVDGGRSWTTVLDGAVRAIRFATAARGWAVTTAANGDITVLRTADGGLTWQSGLRLSNATPVGLDAATELRVWFLATKNGSCTASTCGDFALYRSDDGGGDWRSLGNPRPAGSSCSFGHLSGPVFASPNRGWLGDNTGAGGVAGPTGLLESEDGGQTWTCHSEMNQTRLVSAADPYHVWVTGAEPLQRASQLYASADAGRSWRTLAMP